MTKSCHCNLITEEITLSFWLTSTASTREFITFRLDFHRPAALVAQLEKDQWLASSTVPSVTPYKMQNCGLGHMRPCWHDWLHRNNHIQWVKLSHIAIWNAQLIFIDSNTHSDVVCEYDQCQWQNVFSSRCVDNRLCARCGMTCVTENH